VIGWLASFSLRLKLYAVAAGAVLVALGYLYLRWKIAASRLASVQSRADALQATRDLEHRIATSRAKTRAKQDAIRTEILARAKRDYFEH